MSDFFKKKGNSCEEIALQYFIDHNYQFLKHNIRIFGVEIDLIFKKEEVYYFIEVKSDNLWRTSHKTIHYKQKERLLEAVSMFSELYGVSVRLMLSIVNINRKIQLYALDDDL